MTADPSTFGAYLKGKRKAARLSLREVGAATGLSHVYLSEVERGAVPPLRTTHWPDLVKAIPGVTLADLERAAAVTRPLEIDLSGATADYVDLALAFAERVRNRDIAGADVAALLAALKAEGLSPVRAFGRVLGADGLPVSGQLFVYRLSGTRGWGGLVGVRAHAGRVAGPLDCQLATLTGKSAGLLGPGDKRGAGFFDIPGGLAPGAYALDVHHDGREDWAWPLTVTDGSATQDVRIGGPAAAAPPVTAPAPGGSLPAIFSAGSFVRGFTYYQGLGIPAAVRAVDFAALRDRGIQLVRVWLRWHKPDASSVFDGSGNWVPDGAARLVGFLDQAASFGIAVDLTIAEQFLIRNDSHDETAEKKLLTNLLPAIASHPAVAVVDLANEGESRGKGSTAGAGSEGWQHLSSGDCAILSGLARALAPDVRLTASVDGPADGPLDDTHPVPVAPWYGEFSAKGAVLAVCAPHEAPRQKGWGARTEPYVRDLRAGLTKAGYPADFPIYMQEPARNGSPDGASYSLDEFQSGVAGAKAAGAVAWVFHHGHFDRVDVPVTSLLDATEKQFFDWLGANAGAPSQRARGTARAPKSIPAIPAGAPPAKRTGRGAASGRSEKKRPAPRSRRAKGE